MKADHHGEHRNRDRAFDGLPRSPAVPGAGDSLAQSDPQDMQTTLSNTMKTSVKKPPLAHLEGAAAFLVPLAMYLLLPSHAVSGDGIKYIYLLYDSIESRSHFATLFEPGHLLYLPSMSVLARLFRSRTPMELSRLMLACNQLAAAAGVFLVFQMARTLDLSRPARWMVASALTFSYGYWIQATDVETYAVSLLFATASMHQMIHYSRGGSLSHAVAMGVLIGLASLYHLTLVSLLPAAIYLVVLVKRTMKHALIKDLLVVSASFGLVFGVPLLVISVGVLGLKSPGAIATWLRSADHGVSFGFGRLAIPRAVYGFARTFLFLEFFWEARTSVIAAKGVAIGAMGLWLSSLAYRARARLSIPVHRICQAMIPFLALQVMLGVYYYGSDTERWIFIAPFILLMTWSVLDASAPYARRWGAAIFGVVALINVAQAFVPAALDRSIEEKVVALDKILPANAHVITPGQDWLSYYHYYMNKRIRKTTLLEVAVGCKGKNRRFFEHFGAMMDSALAKGDESIITVRILDPSDNRRNTPWGGIEQLGIPVKSIEDFFARYSWKEVRLDDSERTRTYWLFSAPK